jgi:hypothetical protein
LEKEYRVHVRMTAGPFEFDSRGFTTLTESELSGKK